MASSLLSIGILAVMAVSALGLVQSPDDKVCYVGRYGEITSFSGETLRVETPCKFRAAEFRCHIFDVKITPGGNFDGEFNERFTPDTVYITVTNSLNLKTWSGRTDVSKIAEVLAGEREANDVWKVRPGSNLRIFAKYMSHKGAAEVQKSWYEDKYLSILFRRVEEINADKGWAAGLEIRCHNDSKFSSKPFPQSLCGDGVSTSSVNEKKRDWKLRDRDETVLYAVLKDRNVKQTTPKCEELSEMVEEDCGSVKGAVKACGPIFYRKPIVKCLAMDGADKNPNVIRDFITCLRAKCKGEKWACNKLKSTLAEAERSCPADALTNELYLKKFAAACEED